MSRFRLGEFRRKLSQLGLLNIVLYIINRLLVGISNGSMRLVKYYMVAQPVATTPSLPLARSTKIEVRLVERGEPVVQQFPRADNVIQARYDQGSSCLAAFKEDRCIGFLWFLVGSYQEDEVRARFTPLPAGQTSWDFDVYVVPRFRAGFTFPRLWDAANRNLNERDVRWTCSRISAFNAESLAAHRRLGAVSLGSAVFLCLRRWQITVASIPPFFHFSSRPEAYPEFRLNTQGLGDGRHRP